MGPIEWLMLIVLSLLWGGSFFFAGVALKELSPLTIVTLRVTIAALALWSIVVFLGLRIPTQANIWTAFIGMGLLNNVIPFLLIVWGQTQIASGLASILNATTPLFTVVVAGLLLLDERATRSKLLGAAIGLVGVVLMIGIPALKGANTLAQMAVISAAVSYAFAGVYGRRFRTMGISPIITAAGQVTASALLLVPIALIFDDISLLATSSLNVWLAILALALVSTAGAYVLYFRLLESVGATNLLLVTLLIPVSAILLGITFLNETLQTIHIIGMVFIASGLAVIDGRLWQHYRQSS